MKHLRQTRTRHLTLRRPQYPNFTGPSGRPQVSTDSSVLLRRRQRLHDDQDTVVLQHLRWASGPKRSNRSVTLWRTWTWFLDWCQFLDSRGWSLFSCRRKALGSVLDLKVRTQNNFRPEHSDLDQVSLLGSLTPPKTWEVQPTGDFGTWKPGSGFCCSSGLPSPDPAGLRVCWNKDLDQDLGPVSSTGGLCWSQTGSQTRVQAKDIWGPLWFLLVFKDEGLIHHWRFRPVTFRVWTGSGSRSGTRHQQRGPGGAFWFEVG